MFCEAQLSLVTCSCELGPILWPVVREWWAGADCMSGKSVVVLVKSCD